MENKMSAVDWLKLKDDTRALAKQALEELARGELKEVKEPPSVVEGWAKDALRDAVWFRTPMKVRIPIEDQNE
jgi:hypothetical protein